MASVRMSCTFLAAVVMAVSGSVMVYASVMFNSLVLSLSTGQLPLTRNHPAMLRRVVLEMRTACGEVSLRKMIMVP
jgi:hypothetical protein